MATIAARLLEAGITLPVAPPPAANYLPFNRAGSLVHVAGQIPKVGDKLHFVGKLGKEFKVEEGQECARICTINFLAQVQAAAGGNLDNVKSIQKMNVFVNSAEDFTQQPAVANGVSDLLVKIGGDAWRHARSAVGVAQLPFGVAVEIDGVVELKDGAKL